MTHSSKANREMMHLLDVERCCWKPAWWFSLSWIPGEPQAESGRDLHAEVWDCFLGRYQDSPCAAAPASPGSLLRWKSVQYSMAVGSRHCRVRPEAVGSLAVEFHGVNTSQPTPEWALSNPWRCFSFL